MALSDENVDPYTQLLQSDTGDLNMRQSSSHSASGFGEDWSIETEKKHTPMVEGHRRQEDKQNINMVEGHPRQNDKQNIYLSNGYVSTRETSYVNYSMDSSNVRQNVSLANNDQEMTTNHTYNKQRDHSCGRQSKGHEDNEDDESSSSNENNQNIDSPRTNNDHDNPTSIHNTDEITWPKDDKLTRSDDTTSSDRHQLLGDTRPADASISVIHQLSEDTVEGILRATDVTGTSAVMAIGLSNLDQLKNLNKSDPAIKRLFYTPKINAKEVRNTPIDSDIKTMVSDFLKTNVVGNFIISRVLRENYATFYGWLAAHLQCERNAWALRVKQTLEISEAIRRERTNLRQVVVNTASRLNALVDDCSSSMHPTLSPITYNRRDQLHSARQGFPGTIDDSNKMDTPDIRVSHSTRHDTVLTNVYSPLSEKLDDLKSHRWDATDALRGTTTQPITLEGIFSSTQNYHQTKKSDTESDNSRSNESLATKTIARSTIDSHVRATLDENTDMDIDWKDLLETRTKQIEDLFYVFITERNTCLNMLGVKPHHCYSLVEALASYMAERQNFEAIKRREIEERLGGLETENRKLIEEMSRLQVTLLDKQHDALNLQQQMDKLEAVIASETSPKYNKCVGTEEVVVTRHRLGKLGSTHGNLDKPSSKFYRYKGDVRGSIHRLVKTVNDFMPCSQNLSPDSITSHSQICGSQSKDLRNNSQQENAGRCTTPSENLKYVRDRSLIAISGEKLSSLKHRAKQLEDSLRDAISSLVMSQQTHTAQKTEPLNSERGGRQLNIQGSLKSSTPKISVVKRPTSQRRSRSETILETEATSLLSGRSVTLACHTTTDRYNAQSCLTINLGKDEKTISQTNQVEPLTHDSQTKQAKPLAFVTEHVPTQNQNINRTLTGGQNPEANAKTFVGRHARVISRHRTSGAMKVSKCLRCQKLFSAVDNHKMACFYHIKDKEKIEHFDQSGKLTRVLIVWACCQQSQDTEGCCYGKHV